MGPQKDSASVAQRNPIVVALRSAGQRVRLESTLELAQGLATGTNGGDPWAKWQDRIIEKIKQLRSALE